MAKKKSKIPPKTKIVEVIPQDLKDKWGSITAIATACACMDKGYYPHSYASTVRNSIAFLAKLHETVVTDALTHPQAHMIAELKEIQKQMALAKKEKTDGKEIAINQAGEIQDDGKLDPTPSPG